MDDITKISITLEDAEQNWKFKLLDDSTISIEKYIGNSVNIIVPSYIEGRCVSDIKLFALCRKDIKIESLSLPFLRGHLGNYFEGKCSYNEKLATSVPSSLKTVIIRDGIKNQDGSISLGGTFCDCWNIENIVICDGITDIYSCTFGGCSALKSLSIPDSIKNVGNAFDSGNGIEHNKLKFIEYKNGYYFGSVTNPYFVFVKIIDSTAKDFVLHKDTKIICGKAFSPSHLTQIDIPFGVVSICESAFNENQMEVKSLKKVIIPNSVEIIGESAFESCENLEEIKIPNSVKYVGEAAFQFCERLKYIELGIGVKVIGKYAFAFCKNLTQLKIGNNAETIGYCAFSDCIKIREITLPDSVIKIGAGCFANCHNLEKFIMSNKLVTIEGCAFENCVKLSELVIPKTVKTIGSNTFKGCNKLTIHTKLKAKPRGWESRKFYGNWNPDNCPVIWANTKY